ncbi:MAG TPA: hypothetical protein VGQ37_04655 [Vicinamibacterales bacterium]|nr:hypothetical protein [Vicinamibacterales bacterium]
MTTESAPDQTARQTHCPFCQGRVVDTLAKVITPNSTWRCRTCEKTWTGASQTATTTGYERQSPAWRRSDT